MESVYSLSILLIICSVPVYLAKLTAWRAERSLELNLVATGCVAFAIITGTFFLLALLGLFTREILAGIFLGAGVATYLINRNKARQITSWKLKWSWYYLLLIPIFISLARALLMPPLAWDSFTYHLYLPALWIQDAGFVMHELPPTTLGYSRFAMNAEVIAAWLMIPFGSDLIVNLMNFPFLALGALAMFCVAREFNLSKDWGILLAALISYSPMLYGEVTTAYAEIALQAYLASCLLFTLRFYRERKFYDGMFAMITMSLAIGTKLSAVMILAFLAIPYCIALLKSRVALKIILYSMPMVILLGGSWYLKNLVEMGNPVYPFQFSILGYEIAPMSDMKRYTIEELNEKNDSAKDLLAAQLLFTYQRLAAGPHYFFFILIACVACFKSLQNCSRKEYLFLFAVALIPVLVTFLSSSPDLQSMRRNWPDLVGRFLTIPMSIFALLTVLLLNEFKSKVFKWLILATVLLCISKLNLYFLDWNLGILTTVGLIYITGLSVLGIYRKQIVFLLAAFIASVFYLDQLKDYKIQTKQDYLTKHVDLPYHPRSYAGSWAWFYKQAEPSNIAYYAGRTQFGHCWFFYQLMGHNFQNKVLYLPTETDTTPDEWLEELKLKQIDYVYFQYPPTKEFKLLSQLPNQFVPMMNKEYYKVFKVIS